MNIMPYVHFQGNCAEAMAFYCRLFRGTDLQIMRYGDTPPGGEAAAPGSDRVMHAQFTAEGGAVMMASDFPPGTAGEAQKGVSIMLGPATAARAREIYEALVEGGAVIQPFARTFFSPGFGMARDRFGTAWIIGAAGE